MFVIMFKFIDILHIFCRCGKISRDGHGLMSDDESGGSISDASTNVDFSSSDEDDSGNINTDTILKCDNDIYDESLIANKIIPICGITMLQWLALNFNIFSSHPSISKQTFSQYIKLQSKLLESADISLPTTYQEARKLIDPFLVRKKTYHACINDCVLFRNCQKYAFGISHLVKSVVKKRFVNIIAKRPVARRRFSYIPIGPRLARIFGDVNLAQLVQSHSK